jgi:hypothetical protein
MGNGSELSGDHGEPQSVTHGLPGSFPDMILGKSQGQGGLNSV